ncbi:MAG: hypothetical protein LC772_06260, partial [Chloroflexi bacterium]|nr:hypothetical protein [Chloroflexota bacterium]
SAAHAAAHGAAHSGNSTVHPGGGSTPGAHNGSHPGVDRDSEVAGLVMGYSPMADGLTADQKSAVDRVAADFGARMQAAANSQQAALIRSLMIDQAKALLKILTPDQVKQIRQLTPPADQATFDADFVGRE